MRTYQGFYSPIVGDGYRAGLVYQARLAGTDKTEICPQCGEANGDCSCCPGCGQEFRGICVNCGHVDFERVAAHMN